MRVRFWVSVVLALTMTSATGAAQDDDLVPLPKLPLDDLVPLPKLAPRPDGLRLSPREMHDICLANQMTDANRIHFTPAEYGAAMLVLGKQIGELVDTWVGTTGADSKQAERESDTLFAQLDTLATCQLEEYAYRLQPRAAASCRGLRAAVELLDGPAVTALKRQKITRGDWLGMLESFLPAAKKCRSKLGQCLNPNNVTQIEEFRDLLLFVVDVDLVSNGKTLVSYVLPPCTKTMIQQGMDKQPSDSPIEFIEQAVRVIPVTVEYDKPPIILPVTIKYDTP